MSAYVVHPKFGLGRVIPQKLKGATKALKVRFYTPTKGKRIRHLDPCYVRPAESWVLALSGLPTREPELEPSKLTAKDKTLAERLAREFLIGIIRNDMAKQKDGYFGLTYYCPQGVSGFVAAW